MTTSTARAPAVTSWPAARSVRGSEWRATLALAAREAWLIVRHPLLLTGLVLTCVGPFVELRPHADWMAAYFEVGLGGVGFGVFTFFTVHLCATRASRVRAHDWMDATVTSAASRTTALCLATLAPFALACAILAVLDPIVGAWTGRSADPGPVRLLGSAICVLGGGLLAVAVSRWLRFVGAALVTMIAVIAASIWLDNGGPQTRTLLEPYTDWGQWVGGGHSQPFLGVLPGSPGWHDAYLAGWTTLALCAALLAHRRWRYPVLALAVAAAAITVIAGKAQLP